MTIPMRIQRQRTFGWRKPDGVVDCTRPGPYGNPFRIERKFTGDWWIYLESQGFEVYCGRNKDDAQYYARHLFREQAGPKVNSIRRELRGKSLMCWCALCVHHADGRPHDVKCRVCDPCHVDVLLEIANADANPR